MVFLFNSIGFAVFFAVVFSAYWLLPQKFRNVFLIAASYFFYASWNWRFLWLLIASTSLNYALGGLIHGSKNPKTRKLYLIAAVSLNVAILGFFKYFGFFVENMVLLLGSMGLNLNFKTLGIILPLGISFFTFQKLGYVIDIYRKKFEPPGGIGGAINFFLFAAYFPQLIAGPIERAKNLIPQFGLAKKLRDIDFKEASYLFIYGLFKKIVIADSLGRIADPIFASGSASQSQILIALYAYAFQIYCDFSGYTDMARGISSMLGIRLSRNFNLPYLSTSPSDFWKRWHITLSEWVRDYVYVPLGGRNSRFYGLTALFITWLVMGLWHGAAWNFVLWGIYWFALIAVFRAFDISYSSHKFPGLAGKALMTIVMFHLTVLGWLLFRGTSLQQIWLFAKALFSGISLAGIAGSSYLVLYASALFLILYEIMQLRKDDEFFVLKKSFYHQAAFYLVLFFMFIEIGAVTNARFIYFQF